MIATGKNTFHENGQSNIDGGAVYVSLGKLTLIIL